MIQERIFNAPLALGLPSDDDDILNAKRLFKELERLEEPPHGFSPLFDRPLDETVRAFQQDRGLKEDGLITPGGPTERNIRRDRGELPAEPDLDLSELEITAPIGNGLTNEPEDIIGVSKALGRLGLFNFDKTEEPSPIISRRLVAGIEKFQEDNGLPVTGELKQGDKAHDALMTEVAEKPAGVRLPRGRFKLDAVENSAAVREDEIIRRRVDEAGSERERRSGRFRDTLDAAGKSAGVRQDAIGQREAREAEEARIAQERFKFSPQEAEGLAKLKWKPAGMRILHGTGKFKVTGPIRVEATTIDVPLNQARIRAHWRPLDKNGKIAAEFRSDEFVDEKGIGAIVVLQKGHKFFKPPFEWSNGFQVMVSIAPQQPASGNPGGLMLDVSVPEESPAR